jgi:hypothetical protein
LLRVTHRPAGQPRAENSSSGVGLAEAVDQAKNRSRSKQVNVMARGYHPARPGRGLVDELTIITPR